MEETKPHCLIVPYPLQGHINPMLEFAKRLQHKGIKITFALPIYLIKIIQQASWGSFSVEPISDGFDEGWRSENLAEYTARSPIVGSESLANLLEKLKRAKFEVHCVIFATTCYWALTVAKKYGLVGASFGTQSCAILDIYYHWSKGEIKLPFSEGDEVLVPVLPSLKPFDMPSFMYHYGSHPGALEMIANLFQNIDTADWIFMNSFYKLENQVVDLLTKQWRLRTIGPCIPSMYLDKRLPNDKEYGLNIFSSNNNICMNWINKLSPKSVVYIAFGSVAQLKKDQIEEIAQALKLMNKYFLWVVRDKEISKLPKNFIQETSEKGLIVSWCPQLEILAHEAISCFVTHCGWNSTLEALSLGVPMVGIPWWSDQSTNAKFVSDVWKIGIRVKLDEGGMFRREEIVGCVTRVMDGRDGVEIRESVMRWKALAREAVDEGGNSDQGIKEFVSSLYGLVFK